jgi:hypothetical protein
MNMEEVKTFNSLTDLQEVFEAAERYNIMNVKLIGMGEVSMEGIRLVRELMQENKGNITLYGRRLVRNKKDGNQYEYFKMNVEQALRSQIVYITIHDISKGKSLFNRFMRLLHRAEDLNISYSTISFESPISS